MFSGIGQRGVPPRQPPLAVMTCSATQFLFVHRRCDAPKKELEIVVISCSSKTYAQSRYTGHIQVSNVTFPQLITRHACSSAILLVKCSVLFVVFPTYFFNASKSIQVEDKAHIKRDNSNFHCCQSSLRFVSFASGRWSFDLQSEHPCTQTSGPALIVASKFFRKRQFPDIHPPWGTKACRYTLCLLFKNLVNKFAIG